jgi:hypothetical protein
MGRAFLDLAPADIGARVQAIATEAAGGPVRVQVGDEAHGYRNVGVDLPKGRRSAAEGRSLRKRLWAALEGAGVVMAENAIAPKVTGDLRGSVRVHAAVANGDVPGAGKLETGSTAMGARTPPWA